MIQIDNIDPNGQAAHTGLKAGDFIQSINGTEIRDMLDLTFFGSMSGLNIRILRKGHSRNILIENPDCRSLGISVKPFHIRRCNNHCLFCFVDQMPKGFRKSLYIKDEDYRLSFLDGAYICATNLSEYDFSRIFQQHLSPLYISVHATDQETRTKLLGNPKAPPILDILKRLTEHNIMLHVQVVVCPGINDGRILQNTLSDLIRFHPRIASIAVVPVGLTRHRSGLPRIRRMSPRNARRIIRSILPLQRRLSGRASGNFVYLADEFYLKGGHPLPPSNHYKDFPQYSNGVGMMRDFIDEFTRHLLKRKQISGTPKKIGVISGLSASKQIAPLLRQLEKKTRNHYHLLTVTNKVCGSSVTVTGLLCAKDIIKKAIKEATKLDLILFPPNCLNADGLTLDGYTVPDIEKNIGKPIIIANTFEKFL